MKIERLEEIEEIIAQHENETLRLGIESGRLPENTEGNINIILTKLGLLTNNKLNNGAAVLFANSPLIEYPQCTLRLARFQGINKNIFIDNNRIQGNIFKLLDEAMIFIFKHLSLHGVTDNLEREESLSIPYKAIREGVINALCHRDFRNQGGSVGIAIYDDRLEIENPGTFPDGWDIEKIKSDHCSSPQNPLIASILYKRKLLENWGRGISLIIEECRRVNLPEPEYKQSNGFITLILRCNISNHTSTTQVPHKHHTSTTQVLSTIEAIGDMTYSLKEIMDKLDLKNRKHFSQEYLKPSIELGLVEPIYPNQPKSPKQKYRLTDKGKLHLK